jgi:putative acetyltransferase
MSLLEKSPASASSILIREFQPGDEAAFRALNEEWIARFFRIEPQDRKSLERPQATILDPGGKIFFALAGGQHIGCCALIAMGPGEFEVTKMAVSPANQGSGIGRKLLIATIESARASGARRLYIETNHTLANAIHLYESVGFSHLAVDQVIPSPYERADVYMEMLLT